MKLTTTPPTPPTPTYVLELTQDQLVALALLSHRHEVRAEASPRGQTFSMVLPRAIQDLVVQEVQRRHAAGSMESRVTAIGVNWPVGP